MGGSGAEWVKRFEQKNLESRCYGFSKIAFYFVFPSSRLQNGTAGWVWLLAFCTHSQGVRARYRGCGGAMVEGIMFWKVL